jgi:hypothetical protein
MTISTACFLGSIRSRATICICSGDAACRPNDQAARRFHFAYTPKEMASTMKDIILSMPQFYLHLVLVAALLIAALCTRKTAPSVRDPRATELTTGWGVGDAPVVTRCNLDWPPLRSSAWPPQRDCRLFRDLEATLAASCTAKFEQAIQAIRIGSPVVQSRQDHPDIAHQRPDERSL